MNTDMKLSDLWRSQTFTALNTVVGLHDDDDDQLTRRQFTTVILGKFVSLAYVLDKLSLIHI